MTIGIYKINNILNGKFYIGSSVCIERRKTAHIYDLRINKHSNSKLQRAWNKYGEANFDFQIVQECTVEELIKEEQKYLDTLKPEYNIQPIARSSLGTKHSEEFKNKLRKPRTDITKNKMSQAKTGKTYAAKTFKGFISPEGLVYKEIFNLALFCREHKLLEPVMCLVNKGKAAHHKGWKAL